MDGMLESSTAVTSQTHSRENERTMLSLQEDTDVVVSLHMRWYKYYWKFKPV